VISDLLCKVVDIHHKALVALPSQPFNDQIEQWLSPYRHQCLGHRVGKWFQAGSQARREYHRLFHAANSLVSYNHLRAQSYEIVLTLPTLL
jgi:hypothetical protein